MPQTPTRNLTKPFSIAGFILGFIYMIFIGFGPSRSGEIVPFAHQLGRVLVLGPFCGIFGALIGMGLGLLATAAYTRLRR
jgi:hypothetical protein